MALNPRLNRAAVITGGTRGIGKAVALQLNADGYDCVITGTSPTPPEDIHPAFKFITAELRDRDSVDKLCDHIRSLKPSVVVNNVGLNIKGETASFRLPDYDALLDVNLRAPFQICQAALPGMVAQEGGRIVNITSLWGLSGNAKDAAYCASKFGLDGLTASLAAEVARCNVLVNSVAPGFILTEAAKEAFSPAELVAVSEKIPLGRLGQPGEVAALVAWLVSNQNTYLTGQNILIDGGLTRTASA